MGHRALGEENFNGYFRAPVASPANARCGLSDRATSTRRELEDLRFLAVDGYENEPNGCTNCSNRGTKHPLDEANPRTRNRDGHVIELTETQGASGAAWSGSSRCARARTGSGALSSFFPDYGATRAPARSPDPPRSVSVD